MRKTGAILSLSIILTIFCVSVSIEQTGAGQAKHNNSSGAITACVVGAQDGTCAKNRSYTDNGNGTVTDKETGLTWQKCSKGQSGNDCSGEATPVVWEDAARYCNKLALGGRTDWRLPSYKELLTLAKHGAAPTIDTTYFPNTEAYGYWSSTVDVHDSGSAWYASFEDGYVHDYYKDFDYYVRCVRSAGKKLPRVEGR
jgi:hypothetical protein